MHEHALMQDVLRRVGDVARAEGAARVTGIRVRLGALSHFTPDHFREHFADASRGTLAEGASVEAFVAADLSDPRAADVVLESVEVELASERAR
jgi:hydrogenase nickel incorporation protein HypA/HybF